MNCSGIAIVAQNFTRETEEILSIVAMLIRSAFITVLLVPVVDRHQAESMFGCRSMSGSGKFKLVLVAVLGLLSATGAPSKAGDWELLESDTPEDLGEGILFVEKTVRATGDTGLLSKRRLQLVFFEARFFTLKVIDQGAATQPVHENISAAMKSSFCLAGCNGGFFHPDFRPLGLMIADGVRTNKFESSKLLSGLVIADGSGLRLQRRSEFRDHRGITSLLQAGPFLVDRGEVVRGLSSEPARRRTFLVWDGAPGRAGRWAMGTSSALSLAELGEVLADRDVITEFVPQRALNLDGGSSTGLYFDRGAGRKDFEVNPYKRVRNFLGIVPRPDLR